MKKRISLSLIIPTFNEEKNIHNIKSNIKLMNANEVIIVDGNSLDKTRFFLKRYILLSTKPSRGAQLDLGAKKSKESWLFFLHADTTLNSENLTDVLNFISHNDFYRIAYFRLKFKSTNFMSYFIAKWANLRTSIFKLPFGDQCLIISKHYYSKLGGFANIGKMEDMELMLKIPRKNKVFLCSYVCTSFRKYRKNGILKQGIKNLFCQISFYLNAK